MRTETIRLLLIEDNNTDIALFKRVLEEFFDLTIVSTIEGAREEVYLQHRPIDHFGFIVVNTDPIYELDNLPILKEIREKFKGTMIALSSNKDNTKNLVGIDFNHSWETDNFLKNIRDLIGALMLL